MIGKFGRCPKCGGNMLLEADLDGWYVECLQCSYWRGLDDFMLGSQGVNPGGGVGSKEVSMSESLAGSFEPRYGNKGT